MNVHTHTPTNTHIPIHTHSYIYFLFKLIIKNIYSDHNWILISNYNNNSDILNKNKKDIQTQIFINYHSINPSHHLRFSRHKKNIMLKFTFCERFCNKANFRK